MENGWENADLMAPAGQEGTQRREALMLHFQLGFFMWHFLNVVKCLGTLAPETNFMRSYPCFGTCVIFFLSLNSSDHP